MPLRLTGHEPGLASAEEKESSMPIRAATTLVDEFVESSTPRGLVDIVSGSFGAGHDAAARQIAQELHSRGFVTRTWDIVDLLPGYLGRALRAGYLRQVQAVPSSWAWVLRMTQKH